MAYKNARVDVPLQGVSLGYFGEGFICNDLLTPLTKTKWTGLFGEYGNAHRQLYTTRVYDRGLYRTVNTIDYNLNRTYVIHNHGLKDYVTERDYEETESPFEAQADKVAGIKSLLMIEKEYTISNLLTQRGTYGVGGAGSKVLAGNTQWSDYVNSDPLKDIKDMQISIWDRSKKKPNAAIIPYPVLQTLRFHPKLAGFYGQSGTRVSISNEQLKALFEIDILHVPMSSYVNEAGAEADLWGKHVIFLHQASSGQLRQRTFGYRMGKDGHDARVFIKDAPEMINSDVIIHDWAYNWTVVNPGAGYLFSEVIA